jgi:hypothetical protein
MRVMVLAVLLVLGCKQGVGDRCQLRSDCQSGLACVLPMQGSCLVGGTCQLESPGDQRCSRDEDCAAGLACRRSTSCADEGASICQAADAGVAPDDAQPGD